MNLLNMMNRAQINEVYVRENFFNLFFIFQLKFSNLCMLICAMKVMKQYKISDQYLQNFAC